MDELEGITVEADPIWSPDPSLQLDPSWIDVGFNGMSGDVVPGNVGASSYDWSGGTGGGGFDWTKALNSGTLNSLLSFGSGLYGMNQARQLQSMAQNAFGQSNPFGPYRAQYAQQLAGLMANPGSIVNDPGYEFLKEQGEKSLTRGMGPQGLVGSGNEKIALEKFGTGFASDYLNQQRQLLAQLSGAGIAPNFGSALQGQAAGSELMGQSLASIGYGAVRAGGASAGTPAGGGGSPGRFSSAGGEAAGAIRTANAGLGLYRNVANAAGWETPSEVNQAGKWLGAAGSALGIYSGIEKGGVTGYGQAAASAARLASSAGLASEAVGSAAGYIAAPLALYNFVDNWKAGATGHNAASGAAAGAAIGSIVPGIGTLIGGVIGGAVGAISSAFGSKDKSHEQWIGWAHGGDQQDVTKTDPEGLMWVLGGLWRDKDPNFGATKVFSDGNKYSTAVAGQIESAFKAGKINATTSPTDVYKKVIQPWMVSLPGGWKSTQEAAYGEQQLTLGLINNYMSGKPITWGETQGGKPEYGYTPFKQLTGGGGVTSPASNPMTQPGSNVVSLNDYKSKFGSLASQAMSKLGGG